MSGSGKTTFALNILKNFIKKDKPFLVFDWKKSFRPLMKEDPNVMCFTVGNGAISNLFKTNINRPPKGVNPKEWINTLCDLLTESFNVSFGVHKILLETLDETFQGWGVYENSNLYPNWEHIKRMLEVKARDSKGRETGWYESALRIATVLTFGEFGKVVNYDGKKSLSFEDLFDKKVIFELNSLSNIEKKFFCEFILTYIYKLKKAGIKPVMAAADTFRAASIEQLKIHGKKLDIPVIAHDYNSDPAAVAFDAKDYAKKHKLNCVLIDTAGRMYTKSNLMKEMEKIIRVSKPDLKIFVAESITGNDATEQAKTFNEAVGIDGTILTKADVDEKGGAALSISQVTGKPIYFLGTGQGYNNLEDFKKDKIIKNLGLE